MDNVELNRFSAQLINKLDERQNQLLSNIKKNPLINKSKAAARVKELKRTKTLIFIFFNNLKKGN